MTNIKPTQLVEIARSFSYKYFPEPYKPVDFFCSQKAEVPFKDSEKVSEALYQFCKEQVMKSVNEYIKEVKSLSQDSYPIGHGQLSPASKSDAHKIIEMLDERSKPSQKQLDEWERQGGRPEFEEPK